MEKKTPLEVICGERKRQREMCLALQLRRGGSKRERVRENSERNGRGRVERRRKVAEAWKRRPAEYIAMLIRISSDSPLKWRCLRNGRDRLARAVWASHSRSAPRTRPSGTRHCQGNAEVSEILHFCRFFLITCWYETV